MTKRFGDVTAVSAVSLEVQPGEVLALLGPSGCGKTTTLRMIAGFETPNEGAVRIRGHVVNDVATYRRNLGMVFQHYALFPHMSVFDNVAFGLRMRRLPRDQTRERVREAMALVRLAGLETRRPSELSGGQQQRVALARAIVTRPAVLLLDEPLGALDRKLREQMQIELRALQRTLAITTIFVTHDQEEALTLADRIAVMEAGEIVQIGTPTEIYERPRSRFVSDFIGVSNFLPGKVVERDGDAVTVQVAGLRLRAAGGDGVQPGDPVEVAVRPEKVRLGTAPSSDANCVAGRVENVVYLGAVTYYYVRVTEDVRLVAMEQNQTPRPAHAVGETVHAAWEAASALPLRVAAQR
ncbi:MAG: ABC transporter ATP-binding protein [Candidatus Rokubacteria bacterium]|nr:ABC transporter ATP-binding protein [Candidatus Rokubacteria bacterium]MBI3827356.1 ABC transporter ATP-binding protein [Candidatus Rokubacteria bacterium]